MKTLQLHEEFEMLVLDQMRRLRVLDQLVFGGGTMLRLCFDLPRYSVDFDFYLQKDRRSFLPWAKKLDAMFHQMGAQITDQQEKHFSFLWEIRMRPYPQRLKLEIRKEPKKVRSTELNITHSLFSPYQVRLRTLTLEQMWKNKIQALLDRKEIRDAYDLEFLTRRLAADFSILEKKLLQKILDQLESFSEQDFKSKLGALLETKERTVVLSHRFGYLKSKIAPLLD